MAAPVPTAGWPSRTAAVAGLRRRGLSPNEIAERLGIGRSTVYALMRDIERSAGADTVHIGTDLGRQMLTEARQRGLSVGALAEKIITTVVTEGLIAAVLDDEEADRG